MTQQQHAPADDDGHISTEIPPFPPHLEGKAWPGGFTTRDEANATVAFAFRNGPIEDLHAGQSSDLLYDKSLSRITNAEMKQIMLFACEKVAALLNLREHDPETYDSLIKGYNYRYCGNWYRTERPNSLE